MSRVGAGEAHLTPSQRSRLQLLAVDLVFDEQFRPEEAVSVAADLLAEGVDTPAIVELAILPADLKVLYRCEVEELLRVALTELGLQLPSVEEAGWVVARLIAASMIEQAVPPAVGARRLWSLMDECGYDAELLTMLDLHEAWESSVGSDQVRIEAEMLAAAPAVIAAADRHLG